MEFTKNELNYIGTSVYDNARPIYLLENKYIKDETVCNEYAAVVQVVGEFVVKFNNKGQLNEFINNGHIFLNDNFKIKVDGTNIKLITYSSKPIVIPFNIDKEFAIQVVRELRMQHVQYVKSRKQNQTQDEELTR